MESDGMAPAPAVAQARRRRIASGHHSGRRLAGSGACSRLVGRPPLGPPLDVAPHGAPPHDAEGGIDPRLGTNPDGHRQVPLSTKAAGGLSVRHLSRVNSSPTSTRALRDSYASKVPATGPEPNSGPV